MKIKTPIKKIAKALGVSTQAVYDWKNGKYLPTIGKLKQLAKLEGTTIDALLK